VPIASRSELPYLLASFLLACAILLAIYTRYPIVYGIDGPYYLIQLRSLSSEGAIKYPDPPLTYYLLLPFYLLSPDKNLGLKLAVAFYGGLTSLLLYAAFRRVSRFSGLTAALSFVISPYTLRLANDFLKNYVSLLFLAAFIYLAVNEEDCRRAVILSSITAAAAALSHVLTYGVFAVLALLLFAFSYIVKSGSARILRCCSAGAAATSMILLAIALSAAPQIVGYDTVKLLSFLENPFGGGRGLPSARVDFPASVLLGSAGLVYGILRRSRLSALAMASGLTLILLNLPILGASWLFRFSLMSSMMIPPIAASLVGEVGGRAKLTAFLLILGFMTMISLPMVKALKPSISMGEYRELQRIPEYAPSGSKLLIPGVRLRYWVEALHGDRYEVLGKPLTPPSRGESVYLILEVGKPLRRIPRGSEVVFRGEYVMIVKLPGV